LEEFTDLVRDVLVTLLTPNGGTGLLSGGFDISVLQGFAQSYTSEQLLSMMDILRETAQSLSRSSGGKLDVEICLMRLCEPHLNNGVSALAARISQLEAKIANGYISSAPVRAASVISESAEVNSSASEKPPRKTPSASDDINIWVDILSQIKSDVAISHFAILSDQITAVIDGSTLVLSAKTPFGVNILKLPAISEAIRVAIPRVTSKNLAVSIVQENENDDEKSDKLEALTKFSNIKFE
jgi:hypothetical protein